MEHYFSAVFHGISPAQEKLLDKVSMTHLQ
jgi:hypothetical protein